MQKIPIFDLKPEIELLWGELTETIHDVLRSGRFILGPNAESFEQEAARYLGVRHAIGVNSGTDALIIGLQALGVGPGDEVITTPFTFFATAEAIERVGATPVFVDIEPDSLQLDPRQIEMKISSRTKAILPVHLYGRPAEMDPILSLARTYDLKVIEDAAQAFGSEYQGKKAGALGDVGCYSFFPSKNLGAFGDGGMIVTNDDDIAEYCRFLRQHGSRKKYFNEAVGYNSRLDELQAAVLRVKLRHIEEWNQGRIGVAETYRKLLRGQSGVVCLDEKNTGDHRHVYHQFTVRILQGRRDEVQERMRRAGIETMIYYPIPLHLLPMYQELGYELPQAEAAAREVLSLPIWPQMTEQVQLRVVQGLRVALDSM
ncbi:DegT/DnrJ/EryC1/StrS family aminotransferase [Brevibacillus sp. B_LB10_24]|uniref:DegT/DnrJ/EryC1/StrS family aminotransferase n=1 Tax=Brevibacillus sp. B_LB10_24 TaxID=3380645 RepID=UPI0038BB5127